MLHSLRLQGPQLRFQDVNVLLQPCNRLPPHLYRAVGSVPAEHPYCSGCLFARYADCWAKHDQVHLQQLGVNGPCTQGSSVLLPLAFEQFLLHEQEAGGASASLEANVSNDRFMRLVRVLSSRIATHRQWRMSTDTAGSQCVRLTTLLILWVMSACASRSRRSSAFAEATSLSNCVKPDASATTAASSSSSVHTHAPQLHGRSHTTSRHSLVTVSSQCKQLESSTFKQHDTSGCYMHNLGCQPVW